MPSPAASFDLFDGGLEEPRRTFARDLQMLLAVGRDGSGLARLWRAAEPALSLGRFHRRAPDSPRLLRRLSGGRIVPIGPGVQCLTMAVPSVDWLDPATAPLRPDQVLNRGLRPMLDALRGLGVDVFYPGRDLVTARGRTLAHASFTVMRDGATLIEMHVAETTSFAELPSMLAALDPAGVAAADVASMEAAVSLADVGVAAAAWPELLSATGMVMRGAWADTMLTADEAAWSDHQDELGPAADGLAIAAAPTMLGVVECSVRMRGDRLTELRITGDVIAPFHTLDDIASACEAMPLRMPQVRRALAGALSQPRSFLLGIPDLDAIIERLA